MKHFILVITCCALFNSPALAQWNQNPDENARLTAQDGQERHQGILSDGEGG